MVDFAGPAATDGNMASNFPLRGRKATLWEGGVRGVGLVAGFGLHSGLIGTASHAMFHAVDWLPTLLSIALPWRRRQCAEHHRGAAELDGPAVAG